MRRRADHQNPDHRARQRWTGREARQGRERSALRPAGECLAALLIALWLFWLLSGVPVLAKSQAEETDYRLYQRQVFLINSTLNCERTTSMASTDDGMLWIGTYDGVYRFDGKDMEQMDFGAVHAVNALCTDVDDALWVGTNDNGIAVVRDQKLAAVLKKKDGLPSNTVHALAADKEGRVYAATSNGLVLLRLKTKKDGSCQVVLEKEIGSVELPESLAAGDGQLAAAVDADGFLTLILGDAPADVRVPEEGGQYSAVAFGPEGTLYAGRRDGRIEVFDVSHGSLQKTGEMEVGQTTPVRSLCALDGTLFACTDRGAAFRRGGTFTWIRAEDFGGAISSVLRDFQGNLWLTSARLGLLELCRSPAEDLFQAAGLGESAVNTEVKWKGQLYVGTDDGLCCIDPKTWSSVDNDLTRNVSGVPVQCLFSDSQGTLWICTRGRGVLAVKSDGSQVSYSYEKDLFSDQVRMAIELSDGRIAVCGDDGLSILRRDGHVDRTLVRETGNAAVLCLLEAGDGTLLAGTDGDGLALIEGGAVTRTWTTEDGLPSDTIRRLSKSPVSGKLYAVTNNGISAMTRKGEDYSFSDLEGLPEANSYNVRFLEDGTMLVPGSRGVYVLQEEDLLSGKKDPEYLLLNEEWGISTALTADACNTIDEDNNFYLASSRGVYRVNLRDYDQIGLEYRLQVGKVSLDGRTGSVDARDGISVASAVQRIAIRPEVISFGVTDPDISYYLEGYDKSRVTVPLSQLREITYTGLPAGDYRLHISVLDSGGQRQASLTLPLTKARSLVEHVWFRVLLILIGAALVFLAAWLMAAFRTRRALRKEQERQEEALRIREKQLETANEGVMAIAKALDARDKYTSQHSERVSKYSALIGQEMGMSGKECENLRKVALLHDIGKIGVPDSILNKPGRLTDEEYAQIKRHVDYGAEILSNFTGLDHAVEGARYHHERYDGKGYTHGLKGEEIPLYGRIIGVADAFDAMTSNRVYRGHLDLEKVLSELERCRGTQFDPKIADIMIALVRDGKLDLGELYGESGVPAEKE